MTITPFDFHGHQVRVLADDTGELRWIASDVARALDYRNAPDMNRHVDEEDKGVAKVRTPGGEQSMTVLTESGLYAAILRSSKPQAYAFKRWVTREVLPSIRRNGAYMTDHTIEQVLTDPDTIIKLATDLKAERARRAELEGPATSWTRLAESAGDFSVAEAAKVLSRDPGISIGRDRLFQEMHSAGWIFRTKGKRAHWEASQQRAVDTGRLAHKVGDRFWNDHTEEWELPHPTIRVTAKGLQQLHSMLGGVDQVALFAQPEVAR